MLTNLDLVAFCEKMIGRPYCTAAVYKCTQELLDRKAKQYPSHCYSASRMSKYKKKIAEKKWHVWIV